MAISLKSVIKVLPFLIELKSLFYVEKTVETPIDKKRDTTVLTDYHERVIKAEHAAAEIHNRTHPNKITSQDLTDLLNQKFKLNKSVRSYSRIWKKQ
ncbi:MAG: hypothetical protein CMC55_06630 [Flavobacteriaceae bacterium]|nr:hypothetical protein [Flavobacteriaceae bacterium]